MAFLDTCADRMMALRDQMEVVDPGAPILGRMERPAPTGLTSAELNVRPVEGVGEQRAPDPIRQGDTPARPARMPIVVFGTHRGPVATFFGVRTIAPNHVAAIPKGRQLPTVERTNIRRPPAIAYGSIYELDPSDRYAIL